MNYLNDIPLDVAVRAYNGTSHSPERRGENERTGYADTLTADHAMLAQYADTEEKQALLADEFERYRAGYLKHYLNYLHSRNGLMSSFITGPSGFPVARMQKKHGIVEKRLNEAMEFRKRALGAIVKKLRPELRPIMSGDADAAERLQEKIEKAEAEQALMKRVNAAHKAFLKNPASLDASDLSNSMKEHIRSYVPRYSWEPHPIAPYQLSNLSANIRTMKQRLVGLTRAKEAPERVEARDNARLEDVPADNRIRLFFPGKPDEETRCKLKKNGFRWTPTLGCWQAYRNSHSLILAAEIAGEPVAS